MSRNEMWHEYKNCLFRTTRFMKRFSYKHICCCYFFLNPWGCYHQNGKEKSLSARLDSIWNNSNHLFTNLMWLLFTPSADDTLWWHVVVECNVPMMSPNSVSCLLIHNSNQNFDITECYPITVRQLMKIHSLLEKGSWRDIRWWESQMLLFLTMCPAMRSCALRKFRVCTSCLAHLHPGLRVTSRWDVHVSTRKAILKGHNGDSAGDGRSSHAQLGSESKAEVRPVFHCFTALVVGVA